MMAKREKAAKGGAKVVKLHTATKPRKAKAEKTAKPETTPSPGAGHNDEKRSNFFVHLPSWNEWKAKRKAVDQLEKDVKAAIKASGLLVEHFKISDDLASQNKKTATKTMNAVKCRLEVMAWTGDMKARQQLDLFDEPDRTPSVDKAYDIGKQMSMENKAFQPPFAESTEQYRACSAGYYEHQATLSGGFKPLKAADVADAIAEGVGDTVHEATDDEDYDVDESGLQADAEAAGDTEGDKPAAGWGATKPSPMPAAAAAEDTGDEM